MSDLKTAGGHNWIQREIVLPSKNRMIPQPPLIAWMVYKCVA
jgi:hypothetical protein